LREETGYDDLASGHCPQNASLLSGADSVIVRERQDGMRRIRTIFTANDAENKDVNYIHKRSEWLAFRWDPERIFPALVEVRHRQRRLIGRMEGLGFQLRTEAVLHTLTEEVLKSSESEGEMHDIRSARTQRRLFFSFGLM
jgi:hypothetical protein